MKKEKEYKRTINYLKVVIICLTLVLIGITLNLGAITSNDCKMPVHSPLNYNDDRHFNFTEPSQVTYYWLTDIIRLGTAYLSIGDMFIFIPTFIVFIVLLMIWRDAYRKWKQ